MIAHSKKFTTTDKIRLIRIINNNGMSRLKELINSANKNPIDGLDLITPMEDQLKGMEEVRELINLLEHERSILFKERDESTILVSKLEQKVTSLNNFIEGK